LARFLCGLSSPGLTAARLSRHERFGLASEVPFKKVLAAIDAADLFSPTNSRDSLPRDQRLVKDFVRAMGGLPQAREALDNYGKDRDVTSGGGPP